MRLLFIYNAKSGTLQALLDSTHKLLRPKAYNCKLCEVTFGIFTEKEMWRNFRETSEIDMIFLHKDEFLKQYRSKWLPKYNFPVVLTEGKEALEIFMTPEDFEKIETTSDLIKEIEMRLKN